MNRKIILVLLLILIFQNINCQKRHSKNKPQIKTPATYGLGFIFGGGYVSYDSKTSQYIDNPSAVSMNFYLFYRNVTLNWGISESFTYDHFVIKEIKYHDKKLTQDQRLRLSFNSIKLGYSFKLNNNYTIDPYIGYLVYGINDYEQTKGLIGVEGFCFNIEFSKWFLKSKVLRIFIRDQYNITHLSYVNKSLGNYANILEVGVGGRFGKLD